MIYKTGKELRQAIRNKEFNKPTSGQASEYVQANLVILPKDWAWDFLLFAQRNKKPCPILEVGEVGDYYTRFIAKNADIRTNLSKYRVYKNGELLSEPNDIVNIWRDDFVFFLIGCSFSFEQALVNAGLELRHQSENVNVPMYVTNIMCDSAGKFNASPLVVSMRPFSNKDAIKAVEITRDFPDVHGSPVHLGDPKLIGIDNIDAPDYGDKVTIRDGEIPVFWACGVTPQKAALVSKPSIMITHSPGYMFVSDIKNSALKL
ncbi:MAG: putative hydro-lyase [Clostridia bacterium]